MRIVSFSFCCALVIAFTLGIEGVDAKTIECASLKQSVVQSAINAASDGDVIVLPSGTETWTTVSSGMPSILITAKAITIVGAGIDNTVINCATGSSWIEVPIVVDNVTTGVVRVSGVTFQGTSNDFGIVYIDRTKSFRVDHCRFRDIGKRGMTFRGSVGVVDHCSFLGAINGGINVFGASDGGDAAWTKPLSFGTDDAVYIEDCVFNFGTNANDGAVDCYAGGRYVFRHNSVTNMDMGCHGLDSVPNVRSGFSAEIYDNSFNASISFYRAIYLRGGTGVVFNNAFSGSYQIALQVANYRTCLPYSWGLCDGTNPLDGNQAGLKGYPCRDQIGRSANQSLEPLYEWNNTLNGANVDVNVYTHGCTNPSPFDHIKKNRDYYDDTPRPGYSPFVYPHPLVLTDSSIPQAPTGLRVH